MEPVTLVVMAAGLLGAMATGVVGTAGAAVSAARRVRRRRLLARVQELGRQRGLEAVAEGVMVGRIGTCTARMGLGDSGEGGAHVLVSVHGLPDEPALRQRSEAIAHSTTGDPRFDNAVTVDWSDPVVLGRLPAAVRTWLTPGIGAGRVWMRDGVLVARVQASEATAPHLGRWLDGLLFCAGQLSLPDAELGGQLTEMILSDPEPRVRIVALRALVLSMRPEADDIVARLEPSSDPEVQVLRWWHLQQHDELTSALCRRELRSDSRADAALGLTSAPEPVLTAALEQLWAQVPDRTWGWTLRVLRHNRIQASVPGARLLLELGLAQPPRQNVHVRDALFEALRLLSELAPGDELEPLLLALVRRTGPLRLRAIRLLGARGSIRAVEALLELSQVGLPFSEVRTAAAAAVEQIQGRVDGAERGGLSVVAPPDGRLTLVEPRGGGLSTTSE